MENQPQHPLAVQRKYSSEEKQQIIDQWRQSGLSRQAYCRKNNIRYYSFISWTRKKRVRRKNTPAEFMPLKISASKNQDCREYVRTVFAQIETGSKSIQLYQPVTASFLKQLLG